MNDSSPLYREMSFFKWRIGVRIKQYAMNPCHWTGACVGTQLDLHGAVIAILKTWYLLIELIDRFQQLGLETVYLGLGSAAESEHRTRALEEVPAVPQSYDQRWHSRSSIPDSHCSVERNTVEVGAEWRHDSSAGLLTSDELLPRLQRGISEDSVDRSSGMTGSWSMDWCRVSDAVYRW